MEEKVLRLYRYETSEDRIYKGLETKTISNKTQDYNPSWNDWETGTISNETNIAEALRRSAESGRVIVHRGCGPEQGEEVICIPEYYPDGTVRHVLGVFQKTAVKVENSASAIELLNGYKSLEREAHHRTKNNLQILESLLRLQVRHKDGNLIVKNIDEYINRIHALALIQEILYYNASFDRIDFCQFLDKYRYSLMATHSEITRKVKVEALSGILELDISQANPCALIVNEIAENALKHAFCGRDEGLLSMKAYSENDIVHIEIDDNGRGMPEFIEKRPAGGFGLKLVEMLTGQLRGTFSFEKGAGTRFKLCFERMSVV